MKTEDKDNIDFTKICTDIVQGQTLIGMYLGSKLVSNLILDKINESGYYSSADIDKDKLIESIAHSCRLRVEESDAKLGRKGANKNAKEK